MLLVLNTFVDTTGYRMIAVAFNLAILLFGTICLVIWDIPLGLRVVAYMFAGTDGPLSPMFYTWANILCAGDAQVRALVLAIMNSFGAALTTIIQQFLYPVTEAPEYFRGFRASLGFVCGMCLWVCIVRCFEIRELYRRRMVDDSVEERSQDSTPVTAMEKAVE
jgi:MFS transporter, ACS family, pantothenate transporter